MEEITFSAMRNTTQTEPALRKLLDQFERQHRVRVNLHMLEWTTARQEATQYALHHQGPDVSSMATTWVADLVSMNALQPFSRFSLARLGKVDEFVPASWEATRLQDDETVWAAPWLVDTYVIHYRRDILEQAGIEASTAFESLAKLDETVQRLSGLGRADVLTPLQFSFQYDRFCMMHSLAAWVWGRGGEFCKRDGSAVLFDQPEALAGIRDYFGLFRHLSPKSRERLAALDSEFLFRSGKAAMAFGTLSFTRSPETIDPLVKQNWSAAPLPGPHFVGGVNLVVWKYTKHENAVAELIRFLNSPEVVTQCGKAMLTSPARLSVLESSEYLQDPFLNVITQSARTGRSYFPVRLWGLIEERFIGALLAISNELVHSTDADLDSIIQQSVRPVARRLNMTLAA